VNLYNDIDSFACQWTRNLVSARLIPPGEVLCRDIALLDGSDLDYDQVHIFNGLSGWSAALGLAGMPRSMRLMTGSCPCQSFSSAGKRKGASDDRHLWPEMLRIVKIFQPRLIFGEQVSSADTIGRTAKTKSERAAACSPGCAVRPKDEPVWLDGVRAGLEDLGFAFWAVDAAAGCIGAPHKRQRLFWCGIRADGFSVVDNFTGRQQERRTKSDGEGRYGQNDGVRSEAEKLCNDVGMALPSVARQGRRKNGGSGSGNEGEERGWSFEPERSVHDESMAGAEHRRQAVQEPGPKPGRGRDCQSRSVADSERPSRRKPVQSGCGNGKGRPGPHAESGRRGVSGRSVGDPVRGGGNAFTGVQSRSKSDIDGSSSVGVVLGDTDSQGPQGRGWPVNPECEGELPAGPHGAWGSFAIIQTSDGKFRRVKADAESPVQSLADGSSAVLGRPDPASWPLSIRKKGDVGALKCAGNAFVIPLAAEFVATVMEVLGIEPDAP
jgi:site-specific DNA-cytosine methylase